MIADIVEALVEAGATPKMILAAVRAAEVSNDDALERRRSSDATRQRRRRERTKAADNVTSRDVTVTPRDGSFLSPSLPPGPPNPSTNLSPEPPIVPQKPVKTAPLAEQIFLLQPVCEGRRKSARPDVAKALDAAVKRGGDPALILGACRAFYALPASTKEGGRFANGAAVLLNNDRWRDFLPSTDPPLAVSEAESARRLQHFRDTREWKASWGERPRDAA